MLFIDFSIFNPGSHFVAEQNGLSGYCGNTNLGDVFSTGLLINA